MAIPESIEELKSLLRGLAPGQGAHIPYSVYELFFPPGEPDDNARGAAYKVAQECGCKIQNHRDEHVVVFFKPEKTA